MATKRSTPGEPWLWITTYSDPVSHMVSFSRVAEKDDVSMVRFSCSVHPETSLSDLFLCLKTAVPYQLIVGGVEARHTFFSTPLWCGLHTLKFQNSFIEDTGFLVLADKIPHLKKLVVSRNLITDIGAVRFAKRCRSCRTPPNALRWLDLSGNKQIGHAGARALAFTMTRVHKLNLMGCGLSMAALERVWTCVQSNRRFTRAHRGPTHRALAAWIFKKKHLSADASFNVCAFLERKPHRHAVRCVYCPENYETIEGGIQASPDLVNSIDACWYNRRCYWPENVM